jgi:hypothetical protein
MDVVLLPRALCPSQEDTPCVHDIIMGLEHAIKKQRRHQYEQDDGTL